MSGRAIGIAIVFITIGAWEMCLAEARWGNLDTSNSPLYLVPVMLLICLIIANQRLQRVSPQRALRAEEILVIYCMVIAVGALSSHHFLQSLIGLIAYPYSQVSAHPTWPSLFMKHLHPWAYVSNTAALEGFYRGGTSLYRPENFLPWLRPMAFWSAFLLILLLLMVSAAVLLRANWGEKERLSFPAIQLPLAIIRGEPLFRDRLALGAAGFPMLLALLIAVNVAFPSFPAWRPGAYPIGQFFTNRYPWNVIYWVHISFQPWAIGLAYLVPLDMSFSIWFFFVVSCLLMVAGNLWNWGSGPSFPSYLPQQTAGAWVVLGLWLAWRVRGPFWEALRSAIGVSGQRGEDRALYRWAGRGLLGGLLLLALFCRWAGLPLGMALAFFSTFFLISLAVARLRAEATAVHMLWWAQSDQIVVSTLGSGRFQPVQLVALNSFYWLTRVQTSNPLPAALEMAQLAKALRIKSLHLPFILLLASVVAIPATFWAYLHLAYQDGVNAKFVIFHANWSGPESFGRLESWLLQPGEYRFRLDRLFGMMGGAAVVSVLFRLRSSVAGWPLHPFGYALALDAGMTWFWFPFFIAWVLKWPVVRYGGLRAYNHARRMALGLIVGDVSARSLVFIGSIIAGVRVPLW